MKKPKKTPAKGNPMKGDPAFGYHPPCLPLPPGAKLGGDLDLPPEMWKKLNDIAADPEKYMNDDEYLIDDEKQMRDLAQGVRIRGEDRVRVVPQDRFEFEA